MSQVEVRFNPTLMGTEVWVDGEPVVDVKTVTVRHEAGQQPSLVLEVYDFAAFHAADPPLDHVPTATATYDGVTLRTTEFTVVPSPREYPLEAVRSLIRVGWRAHREMVMFDLNEDLCRSLREALEPFNADSG